MAPAEAARRCAASEKRLRPCAYNIDRRLQRPPKNSSAEPLHGLLQLAPLSRKARAKALRKFAVARRIIFGNERLWSVALVIIIARDGQNLRLRRVLSRGPIDAIDDRVADECEFHDAPPTTKKRSLAGVMRVNSRIRSSRASMSDCEMKPASRSTSLMSSFSGLSRAVLRLTIWSAELDFVEYRFCQCGDQLRKRNLPRRAADIADQYRFDAGVAHE